MNKKILILLIFSLSVVMKTTGKELFKEANTVETTQRMELTTVAIPVETGHKYKISFLARTNSKFSIEENERIRIMPLRYIASRLYMEFYDKEGKEFPRNYINIPVLTQQFNDYARVFYPPEKARSVKVFLYPAKDSDMAVKDVNINTDLDGKEGECINVHPTFEHGDMNLYGHSLGYGGMFYTRPDGKTVWKTGFLGYTPPFPVKENTFYDIFCRGIKYRGKKSYLVLECYDSTNRRPFKNMNVAFSEKGVTGKLKVPANTVYCKLRCYCVILEEFKVNETKNRDEKREILK